eukprot:4055356-Amphidinium_carterae.1
MLNSFARALLSSRAFLPFGFVWVWGSDLIVCEVLLSRIQLQHTVGRDVVRLSCSSLHLQATGFMSNRGRQNVASYLIFDLGVDWRYGAAHFEAPTDPIAMKPLDQSCSLFSDGNFATD